MGVRDSTATALGRLEEELSRAAGTAVNLERPSKPEHGDYATNVALKLAGARRRPPLEIAEELRAGRGGAPGRRGRGGRAAGLPQPAAGARLVRGGARRDRRLRDATTGAARRRRRSASRWRSSPPTRRGRSRSPRPATPPTATPSRACSTFAGHEVEREYYYNDAGTQIDRFRASVEARAARGGAAARTGYQRRLRRRADGARGRPGAACCEQIEATLERFRIHFDTWVLQSEVGRAAARRSCRRSTRMRMRARSGCARRRTGTSEDRVLVRSGNGAGFRRTSAADTAYMRDKLERGFDRAIYVLGADHHGVRGWYEASPACSATTRAAWRCCSTSSST